MQFGDGGTADHDWQLVAPDGTPRWPVARAAFRIRNRNSGKVLGVDAMAMADSAQVVQFSDAGTADHLWWLVDDGSGNVKIQNVNSGKLIGVDQMSTADSARIVQYADDRWISLVHPSRTAPPQRALPPERWIS